MLDKEVVKIAQDRIQLEINEQNANLEREIAQVTEEIAAEGAYHSSALLDRVAELCAAALRNRAQLIWQTLLRFLTTTGISYYDGLSDELKKLVGYYLPTGTLVDLVQRTPHHLKARELFQRIRSMLESTRASSLAKAGTEIDLFVQSLKKRVEMKEKEEVSTVFNIYSPVGAIQTGDSSVANVTQSIDTEVREQLAKVLQDIRDRLTSLDATVPCPKGELLDLAQEGSEELKKPTPNIMRLRSILYAVAISIQTVASMKPAYAALKQVSTLFCVSLP